MRKHLIRNIVACDADVSTSTLDRAPARAIKLADGIERDPLVYDVLAPIGMSHHELHEVRALAMKTRVVRPPPKVADARPPNIDAMEACEAFLSTAFVPASGKLELRFPAYHALVFEGLDARAKGTDAAIIVAHFLARCDDLEKRAARKAGVREADGTTPEDDRDALCALAEAGVTREKRAELGRVVKIAMTEVPHTSAIGDGVGDEERLDALRRIHKWVTVWSGIVRNVITRRDQLIRLGLATRRSPKRTATVPPPTPLRAVRLAANEGEERGPDSRAA